MTSYVLGFCFDKNDKVVLIKKAKPPWQRGKLNGVGGKVEAGESPRTAMRREFKEETDKDVVNWTLKGWMQGNSWDIAIFVSEVDSLEDVRTTTDEEVFVVELDHLEVVNVIPNLRWLIPLCRDTDIKGVFNIQYGDGSN